MLIILCFCCAFAGAGSNCGERAKASQRQKDAGQDYEQSD